MAGNRIFHSVVLVGLSLGGCEAKHAAVNSPGQNAEEEEPAKPTKSSERAPTPPPTPSESQANDTADEACPEGADMPDPPCFYIL